jgi:hypothetical protein
MEFLGLGRLVATWDGRFGSVPDIDADCPRELTGASILTNKRLVF